MSMRFQSLVSDSESTDRATAEVIEAACAAGVAETDVAFVFFTAHHAADAADIAEKVWLELDPQSVIGCSCEGVLGGDVEIERTPGLAVLVGRVPGVRIHPFHITTDEWRSLIAEPGAIRDHLRLSEASRAIIGMGDPFTTPLNPFMAALDGVAAGVPLIGGMASGARQPGGNLLIRNDDVHDDGFVGVSLAGRIDVQTVVSQGCRPIGQSMVITRCKDNIIEQLGGRAAVQVLRDTVTGMSEADQALLQNGLLIGRAISEYRDSFGHGDFLIRNLLKIDQDSGAIALADYVRVGQTVQFHVRDARSASDDLQSMLAVQSIQQLPPAGALLFSCNGRGTRLFDAPGHDIKAAHAAMPQMPVAGFFAAGEIGPVGGKNFIHGHTASLAIFRPT